MVEFRGIVLCDDILAIWFPQFGKPANLMYHNGAFLALQYLRKPPIRQLPTEVAKVK